MLDWERPLIMPRPSGFAGSFHSVPDTAAHVPLPRIPGDRLRRTPRSAYLSVTASALVFPFWAGSDSAVAHEAAEVGRGLLARLSVSRDYFFLPTCRSFTGS